MSADAVLRALDAPSTGLSSADAAARLLLYGRNELPRGRAAPWWRVLARQFTSPLIAVLGAAAALSLAIGHDADAGFIGIVLIVNALIGGSQEWRAERSAQALRRLLQFRASVERDGELREVEAGDVVPGDIVWLESGFRVPADARVLNESGLEVDESLLTGESLAVGKDAAWVGDPTTPVADRRNMTHAGTTVVRGRARAVVAATGGRSSVGKLAIDVQGAPPGRPPLLVRLDRFSRLVGVVSIAMAALVAALGIVAGHGAADMAIFGAALAVSVIPEGLPIAITVALAVASGRMARRGVIVRRLGAVEGLGSCTLIASDKTGTLTCNELTVREVRLASGESLAISGEGFAPVGDVRPRPADLDAGARDRLDALATVAALCNEADLHRRDGALGGWAWRGDPTDIALLSMAHKLGLSRETAIDACPEVNRIAFEPERRFAATYHRVGSQIRVFVKGAPERVWQMCAASGGERADASELERSRSDALAMAASGLRVLAFAEGTVRGDLNASATPPEPGGLRFLGLVGMIDPLRAGAGAAVGACAQAGIGVCMVTGDHPTTALAIARDLGIAQRSEQVVTGERLGSMTDDDIRAALAGPSGIEGVNTPRVPRVRVFARVAPDQKLRIIRAARQAGHFVAVTGDGANDAPALKAANIGVAMGRGGTDVARDASDLVISDDNFATIVAGVEEGRIAFDNIRKVIYLLLATNGAEALMIVGAVATGLPLPLLPTQLLWLNLATEGLQVAALTLEPKEEGVLKRPPRPPRESIFNRLMVERLIVGSLVAGGVSLGAFWWMIREGWAVEEARNTLLLLMVLFENVEVGNSRSETRSALVISPLRNPVLLGSVLLAMSLHATAMHWAPLQRVLGTAPVEARTWIVLGLLSLSALAALEAHKLSWWLRRRAHAAPAHGSADAPRSG